MTVQLISAVEAPASSSWRDDARAALPGWVAARLIVVVALVAARTLDGLQHGPLTVWEGFARHGLLGWDAEWYQRIAVHGYGALPDESYRFFPLVPLIARYLGAGTWFGAGVVLVLVANVGALACGALVHRLALQTGHDHATARRAATCFALAPPAFVLVMGYSEAVALTLAVLFVVALLARRFGLAAVSGVLAGLARPTGLLLAVPAVALWIAAERRAHGRLPARQRARWLLAAVAPMVGTGLYLAWCGATTGRWTKPFAVQAVPGLRGSTVDPFSTISGAVRDAMALRPSGHQLTVLVGVALLVVGARRWPVALTAWAAATLLVAFSAERLGSIERYTWAAVTPLLTLAALGPRSFQRLLPVVLGAGLGVLATLAFTGHYVP